MAEHETNLPIDDQKAEGERASKNAAENLFSPRFIFRSESPPDRGADGSIELRRVIAGQWRATGRRAWCQLKHTSTPRRLADGSISYPVDTKNVNYLRSYPCPFYLLYLWRTTKVLFRWHRDVLEELSRERPGWNEQQEVNIRFSRSVDEALLKEIEVEIDSFHTQVAQLAEGPKFVRFFRPEAARRLLEPDPLFVGREDERTIFQQRMGRGRVVPVTGEPDAGKKELVRQCLCDPAVLSHLDATLGAPVALLVVDVGSHIEPRPLRGLAWGLGLHKSWDNESVQATKQVRERATLLAEELPARVQGQHLLVIIENADRCLNEQGEQSDLDELLGSEPLRVGCAAIISRWGSWSHGKKTRVVEPETRVGPLTPTDATRLLRGLAVEHSLSNLVVNKACVIPELLLPGVIRRAVGYFAIRTANGQVATCDALVDELFDAREHVVKEVLVGLGCDRLRLSDGSIGALGALIAISVLGRQAINIAEIAGAGLSTALLGRLRQIGWLEEPVSGTYRLTGVGCRSLRREFQRLVSEMAHRDDALSIVVDVLQRLVDAIATRPGEDGFDEFSRATEEAIAWARESGLAETRLEAVLIQALLPYVVDDVFFPIPPERAKAVHDELLSVKRPVELGDAVAELALAFRTGVDADVFLHRCSEVVDLAASKPRILAIHIRVLDMVAYRGQQRYHRYREILGIRRKLSSRLLALNDGENADVAILKWSASWLLNAAALAVGIGELEMARESVHVARDAVGRLPEPRTEYGASDRLWLASRLAQIEGRLAIEPLARSGKLREAVDASFAALANTPSQVRWVRLALRAAHRLSEELQTDDQRDELLADIDQRLTIIFGNREVWPLSVMAQATALARDIAACSFDPTRRLQQVWRFLDRSKPATGEAKSLAQLGDARPLLVLARSFAFSATCNDELGDAREAAECQREALRLAREALDAAPSAPGWELRLRLLDQGESLKPEAAWHTDPLGGPRSMIGSNLRESLNAASEWLKNISLWGREEGQLALWCLQREWQSQGSLERWATTTLDPNEFWDELKVIAKR